ncbi:MAG: septal ring lytic transglycosylase RlpA family protein [Campylobacter sp.]|nr:septal ring lytic transglycosylase RlpA family protein [Campylobacter sp.]
MRPYNINGKTYYPTVVRVGDKASGIASWYGPSFHGKKTSNGEIYNMYNLTAAHKTLPMNTIVKVTNLRNHHSVVVRINDRGPFVANRVIDLSKAAATQLGMIGSGTTPVSMEVVGFEGKVANATALASANTKFDPNLGINSTSVKQQSIYQKPNAIQKSQGSLNSRDSIAIAEISSTSKQTNSGQIYNQNEVSAMNYIGGDFMVQIGSFKNLSGAQRYQKEHQSFMGYKSVVKSFNNDNGEMVYRVFLTGFRSEDEARDFAKSGKINGAFIVRG